MGLFDSGPVIDVEAVPTFPSQAVSPLLLGSSLFPTMGTAIVTTGSWLAGSNVITVASTAGLAVGMQAIAAGFPSSTIGSISGNQLVMQSGPGYPTPSPVAPGTNVSITFGQNRWDSTSSALFNTVGAKTAWLGDASAHGNSAGWIEGLMGQAVFNIAASLIATSFPNSLGQAAIFGGKSSHAPSTYAPLVLTAFYVQDSPVLSGNVAYFESSIVTGSSVTPHLQFEQSIYNNVFDGAFVTPFNINDPQRVTIHRYDFGKGQPGARPGSAFIDFAHNGNQAKVGIVPAWNSIVIGQDGLAPVMALPNNYGIKWYAYAGTPNDVTTVGSQTWVLACDATTPTGQLILANGSVRLTDVNNITYSVQNLFAGGALVLGPSNGNQLGLSGATAGNSVGVNVAGVSATIDLTLLGKGAASRIVANSNLNLAFRTAPASPVDGDLWYDGTNIKLRVGATTKTFTLT